MCFFFSSRRRHTRLQGDWSSDVCSSDLQDDMFVGFQVGSTPRAVGPGEAAELSVDQMWFFTSRTVEIGRASCRERVEISGVDGGVDTTGQVRKQVVV